MDILGIEKIKTKEAICKLNLDMYAQICLHIQYTG